ncbi:hypothetical protein CEXT_297241 [Caerostris extrusa]|uniref:Uncharacterized protein n=1 Tax=Caerostris extrusa TaxID=172846 RepID=A0AAV4MEH8_CAEEX|nr:hypothetical protein CEXT_297241 [Caerostris extrusa]
MRKQLKVFNLCLHTKPFNFGNYAQSSIVFSFLFILHSHEVELGSLSKCWFDRNLIQHQTAVRPTCYISHVRAKGDSKHPVKHSFIRSDLLLPRRPSHSEDTTPCCLKTDGGADSGGRRRGGAKVRRCVTSANQSEAVSILAAGGGGRKNRNANGVRQAREKRLTGLG